MVSIDNLWLLLATCLVFIMHLGFATLESGMTQSKNTVNILFKNTIIPAMGLLTYAYWGYSLMYPDVAGAVTSADGTVIPAINNWLAEGWFGFDGFGILQDYNLDKEGNLIEGGTFSIWTDFIFQGMFAATTATIVSGAVAERVKLHSFLVFSLLFVGITYPIAGSWTWSGGGFFGSDAFKEIAGATFHDFAGSTLVHSVGGWGALAGIILLGPRVGKFVGGSINPIPGHNLPLATIGVFLLWFGWFGFNGGSVLSADPTAVASVFVTTSMAASGGAFGAFIVDSIITKGKHDLTMVLNGVLAGLVGITAGADVLSYNQAVIVGLICGAAVVGSVIMFDKLKLDDPVGATSVHLVCGILGTLFVSLSDDYTFVGQLIPVLVYGVWSFGTAFIFFFIIKKVMGLRVSEKIEIEGLDFHEHGLKAYRK